MEMTTFISSEPNIPPYYGKIDLSTPQAATIDLNPCYVTTDLGNVGYVLYAKFTIATKVCTCDVRLILVQFLKGTEDMKVICSASNQRYYHN